MGRLLRWSALLLQATPVSCWLAGAVMLIGVVWIQVLPADLVKALNAEDGPFEQASVAFLAASALLAVASWWQSRQRIWASTAVVLIYATLRELDFQTLFTYRSVMSLGYYTRDRAAWPEKLLVLLLVAPCLLALGHLLLRAWRSVRQGALKRPALWSPLAMGAWIGVFFVLSHLSDRTVWFRLHGHVEAWIEAILALLVLLLVLELKPSLMKAASAE
ncbi:MAG: hypothetical protein FJ070_09965 [Cyanobacteria bacterium K_DeepCast_150m_m2_101]|nr:hypothetical protein [Cyanobacteria bacterium K_DeepCast_150m_m2_101]